MANKSVHFAIIGREGKVMFRYFYSLFILDHFLSRLSIYDNETAIKKLLSVTARPATATDCSVDGGRSIFGQAPASSWKPKRRLSGNVETFSV